MAALAQDRVTRSKSTGRVIAIRVAAGALIYLGAQVAVNAAGYAIPATGAAGERHIGIAQHRVDNTEGSDGDVWIFVQKGVFELENSTTAPVAQAQVGTEVFVEDDQTIAATGTIAAGILDSIDDEGRPWVFMI